MVLTIKSEPRTLSKTVDNRICFLHWFRNVGTNYRSNVRGQIARFLYFRKLVRDFWVDCISQRRTVTLKKGSTRRYSAWDDEEGLITVESTNLINETTHYYTGADLRGTPPPSGIRPPTDPKGPPLNYFEISNCGWLTLKFFYTNFDRWARAIFGQHFPKSALKRLFWPVFFKILPAAQLIWPK